MAQIIGAFRLGRDAELRYTPGKNEPVCNLALAFNWGQKGEDGNRPNQWLDAAIWGNRAEALAPYLLKGSQVYAVLSDPHIETYEGKNGQGHKLVARVLDIELVGKRQDDQGAKPAPRNEYAPARGVSQPAPQTTSAAGRGGATGFDDMDDDLIPF
jgi:single-strand DNA-binding protein